MPDTRTRWLIGAILVPIVVGVPGFVALFLSDNGPQAITGKSYPLTATAAQYGTAAALEIDQLRAQNNVRPVFLERRVSMAAELHSADLVRRDTMSHKSWDNKGLPDRLKEVDYCARYAAENVYVNINPATGFADALKAWANSSGHLRNVLEAEALDFGIGKTGKYWVLILATPC